MLNVVKHPYFLESSRSFTLFRMTNRVYITLKHYCLFRIYYNQKRAKMFTAHKL